MVPLTKCESMNLRDVYDYYSRSDVQDFFIKFGENREVVGVFRNGSYGARPNTLVYPQDIVAMVKEGALEFHSSIERWSQPMNLRQDNYDELRIGWDLVLDLDCKVFEHGKIAAEIISWALKKHGMKNFSLKFTGGTGFHVGIPWESFPEKVDYKPSVSMFPELPRRIGLYLREFCRERLEKALLKKFDMEKLAEQTNRTLGEISSKDSDSVLDPFKIVDIDPVLISPRHLFRMPYSLNKNTGLVSLPVKLSDLPEFQREDADPDTARVRVGYLDSFETGEAETLVVEAVDWYAKKKALEEKKMKRKVSFAKAVPEELFPPCAKNILKGLPDGRKRSVFILITLMRSLKWGWEEIEKRLWEWNQTNKPPLGENYIRGQLRWHRNQKRDILPPGCAREGWYESFGVCKPDETCGQKKSVKNPVNYPFVKLKKRKFS